MVCYEAIGMAQAFFFCCGHVFCCHGCECLVKLYDFGGLRVDGGAELIERKEG